MLHKCHSYNDISRETQGPEMSKISILVCPLLVEFSLVLSDSTYRRQYETGYCTEFKSCKMPVTVCL